MNNLFYRGPLERVRLKLLIEAMGQSHGHLKFWWAAPVALSAQKIQRSSTFLSSLDWVQDFEYVDGRYAAWPASRARMKELLRSTEHLFVVGADALPWTYGARARSLTWCLNGIPEERALSKGGAALLPGVLSRGEWELFRMSRRPDCVVVVSHAMSELVRARLGRVEIIVAPNAVDREVFFEAPRQVSRPPVICYLGSGAPWQAISRTASIWRAIAQLSPSVEFLVISKDQRTKQLIDGLDARARTVWCDSPTEVAQALQGVRLGMLVRRQHLVNEVSAPTKFGEYVACGVPVLATRLSWDVSSIIDRHECGSNVPAEASILEHARLANQIVDWNSAHRKAVTSAAAPELDSARLVADLAKKLRRVLG